MSPSANTLTSSPAARSASNSAYLTPKSTNPLKRSRSPNPASSGDDPKHPASSNGGDKEEGAGDRRRVVLMHDLYARSERVLAEYLSNGGTPRRRDTSQSKQQQSQNDQHARDGPAQDGLPLSQKRSTRTVDEDDYGDDDEDMEDSAVEPAAPALAGVQRSSQRDTSRSQTMSSGSRQPEDLRGKDQPGSSAEDARRQLEHNRKAAEEVAKQSFHEMFYTLENDKDAMEDQQKLDELDEQIEEDSSGQNKVAEATPAPGAVKGTLSSANLGASSLTMKHLIAKIDEKRTLVQASDHQLRKLMADVRKGRSKWANEERVGQEELYEPAETVLKELKAQTDFSTPFLKPVIKRDAPDYHRRIAHPMDLQTMFKKLNNYKYTSKREFVHDLTLIWSNCLEYNSTPEHPLRKKAQRFRAAAEELSSRIDDITVRDRADVEAQERREHPEFDDAESEDEPLMSSRGRMAPTATTKQPGSRKAYVPPPEEASSPAPEPRPDDCKEIQPMATSSVLENLKKEHLAESSSGSQRGGTQTPDPADQSLLASGQSDADVDEPSITGVASATAEEPLEEDEEFQIWKQITKLDRARVAQERHRLFGRHQTNDGATINQEEPALLRKRSTMRRLWRIGRSQNAEEEHQAPSAETDQPMPDEGSGMLAGEHTNDDASTLPDYYLPLSGVPAINNHLEWQEDAEGQIIDRNETCLRLLPKDSFHAPNSKLANRINKHLHQMQDTRKVSHKINVVKQMQLMGPAYQRNQFPKYDEPLLGQPDLPAATVSDDGPIMDKEICRNMLQRSIGKIFYHAGFESFHPSALDTMTELTSDMFTNLFSTMSFYRETDKVRSQVPQGTAAAQKVPLQPRFTDEEIVLHTLQAYGQDLEGLEAYVTEDLDRHSSRLEAHAAKARDYYSELLRPAFHKDDKQAEGVNFSENNAEAFISGNFGEELDEDFLGLRELGLDKEFGLEGLSVPLHLIQTRLQGPNMPEATATTTLEGQTMPEPPRYDPITIDNVDQQIGLVREWFRKRLEDNDDEPLVEDSDLPVKQQYPKPRLPPTGKITSPRKRPIREQQQMARRKRRLEIEAERAREREREAAAAGVAMTPAPSQQTGSGSKAAPQADTEMPDAKPTADAANGRSTDAPMVNGVATYDPTLPQANGQTNDLDALFDDGDKPLTPKSVQRLKLEAPKDQPRAADPEKKKVGPAKSQINGSASRSGTPQRRESSHGNAQQHDDDGDAEGDEDEGQTGMISPESVPIAAH